jgi:hypothetical protein
MKKGVQRAVAGVLVVAALVQMISVAFVKGPNQRK